MLFLFRSTFIAATLACFAMINSIVTVSATPMPQFGRNPFFYAMDVQPDASGSALSSMPAATPSATTIASSAIVPDPPASLISATPSSQATSESVGDETPEAVATNVTSSDTPVLSSTSSQSSGALPAMTGIGISLLAGVASTFICIIF